MTGRAPPTGPILVPFGTRPEVIKLAPVVRALRGAGNEVLTVATGQHSDPAMAADLHEELGLRPQLRLRLPSDPARRQGALTTGANRVIAAHRPRLLLVLGDTSTVPAYALAARAAAVPVVHLEAGLRSLNPRSLEETHRRIATACAQLHLAPTERAAAFLAGEGVPDQRIRVVGNPVVDALRQRRIRPVPVHQRQGVLLTAHRAGNVDDPTRLARLVRLVAELARCAGPLRFPVHPRTEARLAATGLAEELAATPGVRLSGPLRYDELLAAIAGSRLVVTDSGGIQEEAAYFGVPVVVLRRSTPRWEGVEAASTVLAGLTRDAEAELALAAARRLTTPAEQRRIAALPCPYGAGDTGPRVARLLADPQVAPLLELGEPDYTGGALPW